MNLNYILSFGIIFAGSSAGFYLIRPWISKKEKSIKSDEWVKGVSAKRMEEIEGISWEANEKDFKK